MSSSATGALVLPFYCVIDVSPSMTVPGPDGVAPIVAANEIIPSVFDALDEAPLVGDKVLFGVCDFADDASTVLALADPRNATTTIPQLAARGVGTSYAAAFRYLRQAIDTDVAYLKADNKRVYRPVVFFVTDGEPTDDDHDWQAAFAALVDDDFKAHPYVIPFGVAGASKDVLQQLAANKKQQSFLSKDKPAAEAIRSMIEMFIVSIVSSANDVNDREEDGGFVMPEATNGDWI